MSVDGREEFDRHVYTFRIPPVRHELDAWLDEHAPEAEIRPGGGLQVLIRDTPTAFLFALVWRGTYSTSFHPHARPPHLPPPDEAG